MKASLSTARLGDYAMLGGGPLSYTDATLCAASDAGRMGPGRTLALRAKKSRMMRWLVLSADGTKQQLTLDKRQLIQTYQLDIPIRDMRLLDVTLMAAGAGVGSGPAQGAQGAAQGGTAQLLVRDNAMLLVMEHVRMIITADKAILPVEEERQELAERFMCCLEHDLQERLAEAGGGPGGASPVSSQCKHGPAAWMGTLAALRTSYQHHQHHQANGRPLPQPPLQSLTQQQQQQQAGGAQLGSHPVPGKQQPLQKQPPAPGMYNWPWLLPPNPAVPTPCPSHPTQPPTTLNQHRLQGSPGRSRPASHPPHRSLGSHGLGASAGCQLPNLAMSAAVSSSPLHHPAVTSLRQEVECGGQPQGAQQGGQQGLEQGTRHGARASEDVHGEGPSQGTAPGTPTGFGRLSPSPSGLREQEDGALPFELFMLEAALGEVCSHLGREVDQLQAQANPALEDLVAHSNTRNLERVRRVKTAHQRLINRAGLVHNAMHRLLEDDADMFRMCLTSNAARKAASQVQAQAQLAAAASLAAGRSCSTNHLAGLQQQQGISAPALFPSPPPTHPVDSSSSFPAPPAQTLSTPSHTPGCPPSAPAAAAGLGGSGQGVNGRQVQQVLLLPDPGLGGHPALDPDAFSPDMFPYFQDDSSTRPAAMQQQMQPPGTMGQWPTQEGLGRGLEQGQQGLGQQQQQGLGLGQGQQQGQEQGQQRQEQGQQGQEQGQKGLGQQQRQGLGLGHGQQQGQRGRQHGLLQELLQATGQGHSTASPGTLEQGQGQEQQPLSEQALPHAKAQRQGQGEQGQGGAPQRQLSCVPEQGPALASSLASQHSTGLPHQYTGQELSGLPCWTSGSHLSTAFSRQSATLASNIFPDAGSPPCDPSFAGGLRISGTRRASLDCVPESPMMLGSASLRPQSMLAVKLRQLHHKAAVAAAAAAVVDGGMTSQEGANGLPAPLGVGTGQLPTVADLLDEDEMHEVLDVEALLEAYFMMAESTLATLRNIGEYIDDTEDLVNINLDYSRNRLIRFEILITTATFALGCYSCIASVLGENLVLPEVITQDVLLFFMVNGVAIICSCSVFMLIVLMLRLKKLI